LHGQTFQVSRNYREIPAFLFAFTRITHEVTFRIFELNLSRFLPVGKLLPFLFICRMFNAFFCQRQYPEVLKMCVSIAYQKETKSWETPEPEERYFLPFGKEERR
jgi:hypothetical protein